MLSYRSIHPVQSSRKTSYKQRVCLSVCLQVIAPSIIILITFLPIIIAKTLIICHCGFCLFDIGWAVCDELFVLGGVGLLAG